MKSHRSDGVRVGPTAFRHIKAADQARDRADWLAARRDYTAALEVEPQLAHVWLQLGHAAKMLGDLPAAEAAYLTAHHQSEGSVEPLLHLARLLQSRGDESGALHRYEAIVRLAPDHEEANQAIDLLEEEQRREDRTHRPCLPEGMSLADAQAILDAHYWHHGIDFGEGLAAKSKASPSFVRATASALYAHLDLGGRSVLDVGTWTGAYALEAKRRGAGKVLATDHYVWANPEFRGKEAFDVARRFTGLDIDDLEIDVPDISQETVGLFDVVLFAGVFYHLLDPVHLTRQVARCARHVLILETVQDALDSSRPAMVFYPGTTLAGDGSNWWGPNPHCVYELLTEFGFKEIYYRDAPMTEGRSRGIFQAFRDIGSVAEMGVQELGRHWLSLSDPEARRRLFAAVAG